MVYGEGTKSPVVAVDDVSLEIERGEVVSIIGPSGCGKTTLIEAVAGLREPSSGVVTIEGLPIDRPGVRRRIGVVFQEDTLFPWRTVMGNAEYALEMRGVAKAERRDRAMALLRMVGLADWAGRLPSELSGGMRQRVAVVRALSTQPALLLLDEPFGALDAQTRLVVATEVSSLAQEVGSTVLLVTHSIEEAALLSDRVAVMTSRPGRIKAQIEAALERPRGIDWAGSEEVAHISGEIWHELQTEVSSDARPEVSRDT